MQAQRFITALRLALVLALFLFQLSSVVAQVSKVAYPAGYISETYPMPVLAGTQLYYAYTDAIHGKELAVADANLDSARLTNDIFQGGGGSDPHDIIPIGDKVVFTADDGQSGRELYVSDGTHTGTKLVVDLVQGAIGSDLYNGIGFDTFAIYSGTEGIYATNGTALGTRRVFQNGNVYNVGGRAILAQNQFSQPDSVFLYDYAANSRTFLASLSPGTGSSRGPFTASFGTLFVLAFGDQILVSNGTRAGSFIVTQAGSLSLYYDRELALFDGRIYFAGGTTATGTELFSIDPQTGIARPEIDLNLRNNGADGSNPSSLTVYGDTLFFFADNGFIGSELYKFKNGNVRLADRELALGQGGRNASLDSTAAGLLVGGTPASPYAPPFVDSNYFYSDGRLQATAHVVVPEGDRGFFSENKLSSVATVPGKNIQLVAFRSDSFPDKADTLVRIMDNGTLRYFTAPADFLMPIDLRPDQIVVAGRWIYFTGPSDSLWRIGLDVVTENGPSLKEKGVGLFYPNPASGRLLSYSGNEPLRDVEVVDALGKTCYRSRVINAGKQIDLSGQPAGLYLIKGITAGRRQTYRIVLE